MPVYDFIIVPTLISTFYPPYLFHLNEHNDDNLNDHFDGNLNEHFEGSLNAQHIALTFSKWIR